MQWTVMSACPSLSRRFSSVTDGVGLLMDNIVRTILSMASSGRPSAIGAPSVAALTVQYASRVVPRPHAALE